MVNNIQAPRRGSEWILQWGKYLYGEKFDINTPELVFMYRHAYYYFQGRQELCEWDISKGLLFCGTFGNGKTACFSVMQRIFNSFQIHKCKNIVDELEDKERGKYLVKKTYGKENRNDIMLDDIGAENNQLFLFRNEVNIIDELILDRYDILISDKVRTHGTSNFESEDFEKNYGPRSYDRMKEMFNLIYWTGKSLR